MAKTLTFFVCIIQLLLVHSLIEKLECEHIYHEDGESSVRLAWQIPRSDESSTHIHIDFPQTGHGLFGKSIDIAGTNKEGIYAVRHFVYLKSGVDGYFRCRRKAEIKKNVVKYCSEIVEIITNILENDEIDSDLLLDSVTAIRIGPLMVKGTSTPSLVAVNQFQFTDIDAKKTPRTGVEFLFTDVDGVSRNVKIPPSETSTAADHPVKIGRITYTFTKTINRWLYENTVTKDAAYYTTDAIQSKIEIASAQHRKIIIDKYTVQIGSYTASQPLSRDAHACDMWDAPLDAIPLEEFSHAPEANYEFYGTKSSKEGGVERDGDEIKCNGNVIFEVEELSKTLKPWNWRWRLTDSKDQYEHVDGLIFMNLGEKYYIQLLPKETTGCILQKEISYVGRKWACENDDLANYNLYMWTMGDTRGIDLAESSKPDIYCNGKSGAQKGMWCQLYAQNNVLQCEVDTPRTYGGFQAGKEKETWWKTHVTLRKEGFTTTKLKPGLKRFGLLITMSKPVEATEEEMKKITLEFMIKHECIGVLIHYTVCQMVWKDTDEEIKSGFYVEKRGLHWITYKYLGGQGWFYLDASVDNAHGPFKTLVDAERKANEEQLRRNDHREVTMRRVTRHMTRGKFKKRYWKIEFKQMYFVNKDVDLFKEKYGSVEVSSGSAKWEMYDDLMNHENRYESYEPIYGVNSHQYIENGYLLDYYMEIMILLSFICVGMCFFAIIGFTCNCLGFGVSYLFIKYQQNRKVIQNQYDIVNNNHEIDHDQEV